MAVKLVRFKVTHHQISKRILRMNTRLENEFGEHVADRRGWNWALASFVMKVMDENGRFDKIGQDNFTSAM